MKAKLLLRNIFFNNTASSISTTTVESNSSNSITSDLSPLLNPNQAVINETTILITAERHNTHEVDYNVASCNYWDSEIINESNELVFNNML